MQNDSHPQATLINTENVGLKRKQSVLGKRSISGTWQFPNTVYIWGVQLEKYFLHITPARPILTGFFYDVFSVITQLL
jgi:hypothetical protein